MAIKITGDEIRFTSASGEVTTYKQEDAKDVFVKRKTDDGLPMKRLRSFESASTFIDLNASGITPLGHSSPRGGFTKGESIDIFVKDNYEAFHIDPFKISLGVKTTLPIELTGSLFSTGVSSSFDFSQMSMDITQGGFFGLAVSGSSLASNLHNMANNLSGLFLTGSNVIISGSTSLSGSTIITGGDTEITGSLIQSGSTTLTGGDVTITGSTVLSGSTTVINSEFTQSGTATFEGGTTTFETSSVLPSGFASGSLGTGSSEVVIEGDLEITGSIIENYTNNVAISASITLTTALHGQGRQLFVRSGSHTVGIPTSGNDAFPAGLPGGNGIHTNYGPAGNMVITLPSASVGMSFHIINHNSPSNVAPFIGNQYGPSLYIDPSGSQRFAFGANGGAAVAGKAIINYSGSNQTGDFIKVHCISSTAPQWMIFQTGGTWTDEA